ncbi:MAG: DNA polymerase III subunit delta [Planctomycetota bacterium]|jgi:DNA polymerase III delta subunit
MAARKKTASKPSRPLDADCRIVVLHGSEDLLIRLFTQSLAEALTQRHAQIQTFTLDATTTPLADVLDECRSFGLMQQHKLVIVDNAELLIAGTDEDDQDSSGRRRILERYAESPVEDATLVLRANRWHRGKLDKLIDKVGLVRKCDELDQPSATSWVSKRSPKEHEISIEDDAAVTLVRRVGVSLGKLNSELSKLASTAKARSLGSITRELVDEMVAATAQEQFWEVQNRLLAPDPTTAIQGVRDALGPWKCDPVMVSWAMLDLARKTHAVAALSTQGQDINSAAKAAGLWGPSRNATMTLAQSLGPNTAADLLARTAAMDARYKTGQREPARWLEVQAIEFASHRRK